MTIIWKYKIGIGNTIKIPKGAKVLSSKIQNSQICLWIKVNTDKDIENRRFVVIGTGHEIDNNLKMKFIDTVINKDESLVFHIFEVIN